MKISPAQFVHPGLSPSQQIIVLGGRDTAFTLPKGDITTGLAVYFKLDEGIGTVANDSSGNGKTGTLENGATWAAGKIGPGALSTSGDASISIAPAAIGSAWTISAWTKFPLPAVSANTLVRDAASPSLGNLHVLFFGQFLGIYMQSDGTYFHSSGYSKNGLTGWHLVTAVGSGGTTKFFIDAAPVGSVTAQAVDPVDTIGNNTASQAWGTFDDFRIYTRALSQDDITALYKFS